MVSWGEEMRRGRGVLLQGLCVCVCVCVCVALLIDMPLDMISRKLKCWYAPSA